ncbi:MAG: Stp1/IreP family PP2C-type Ser/Thr phosphatase [Defluviitaleaceae bacterium]|nr:Stp1/IreP family PP2C-type Ser/Thr phosphatase [Defluviitaleaceae bacterium]
MLEVFAKTDVGRMRSINQDSIFVSTQSVGALSNLFIVADGMGGHNAGEVASGEAIKYFCGHIMSGDDTITLPCDEVLDMLTSAAYTANIGVRTQAQNNPQLAGMGTTLTACTICNSRCNIVHIGDSRAYQITEDNIYQLTTDHSYVNEMLRAGQITPAQAINHPKRNVLTKVLGVSPDMMVDGYVFEIIPRSTILLCSDGLYNMVSEEEIKFLINTQQDPAIALINAANRNGGADNIAVIVIKCD